LNTRSSLLAAFLPEFNLAALSVGSTNLLAMTKVFLGSEALARGDITRYKLQHWYRRIYPDVYVEKGHRLSLEHRIVGAWLWSGRRGIVAGVAASALHGARWVGDDIPVELIWNNGRPPRGVIARNEQLSGDEVTVIGGLPVTTVSRTAFDLGRHLPRDQAVARLDALARATGVTAADASALAQRHNGARGVRRLRAALALLNPGSQSPRETWLRLLLIDSGFPPPATQIVVHNGDYFPLAYLDMGWEAVKVAVEYDGDQHRSDRRQYLKDMSRLQMVQDLGWLVIRVVAEDHPNDIVDRVYRALSARGFTEIDYIRIATRSATPVQSRRGEVEIGP
jgi:Protein of unknown function (DUF559)